ncbi:hypothetical protein [Nonomuraea sp. NPDC049784]|uniref:hypothetical protein n=1 Tax=Nonomuraea sp. NPDC049784 TaxID=3154361 RepID=UPI0033E4E13D
MLFIELLVPMGVFDEHERRRLADRLTGRRLLSAAEGQPAADPGVIDLDRHAAACHGRVRWPRPAIPMRQPAR